MVSGSLPRFSLSSPLLAEVVYSIETKGQGPELKGMMEEAAAEVDELLKAYDEYGENYNW